MNNIIIKRRDPNVKRRKWENEKKRWPMNGNKIRLDYMFIQILFLLSIFSQPTTNPYKESEKI